MHESQDLHHWAELCKEFVQAGIISPEQAALLFDEFAPQAFKQWARQSFELRLGELQNPLSSPEMSAFAEELKMRQATWMPDFGDFYREREALDRKCFSRGARN